MAATTYERDATDLAWEVIDKLNEMTGRTFVVESGFRAKYLRVVDTDDWRKCIEFTGSTWWDVYQSVRTAWSTCDAIGKCIKED